MTTGRARGEGVRDEAHSVQVLQTQERFDGAIWTVRTDEVRLDGGDQVSRDAVRHPGAVGVIALDDDDRVLLVRQYRHPAGAMLWEPPAGLLDVDGEPPAQAAARELYEEAGYRADRWHVLVDAFTSPGMSNESIRIFLARGLHQVGDDERYEGAGEERDMPLTWLALPDAVAAVMAGRLHNPMAVMGILAAAAARPDGFASLREVGAPWLRGSLAPS